MGRLSDELAAQWQRVDQDNTRWLADVVRGRGWPGRKLAGEDGAAAAWLLAQHADRDPARQQTLLAALRGAVDQGDATPSHLAYLEDRVRVNTGRLQLYGTQFTEPTVNLAYAPSRIRTCWTSAARKAASNRSPTTQLACAPCYSSTARANADVTCPGSVGSYGSQTPGPRGRCKRETGSDVRKPFRAHSRDTSWCDGRAARLVGAAPGSGSAKAEVGTAA